MFFFEYMSIYTALNNINQSADNENYIINDCNFILVFTM